MSTHNQQEPKPSEPSEKADEAHKAAKAQEWVSSGPTGKGQHMPLLMTDQYTEVKLPDLPKFDLTTIKPDATVVCVGKRRTGKSFLMRHMMYMLKSHFKAGIVISETAEMNHFWQEFVPEKFIHNRYHGEIIQAVFERQKFILNQADKSDEQKEEEARFFIILDDVISDYQLRWDENFQRLFTQGRHYKIFVVLSTQYVKGITPTIRGNTDYVFMFKNLHGDSREALWKNYGDIMTKDGFFTILDAYTEDNEALMINTSDSTMQAHEMIFWFKAIDPGKFVMGDKTFWQEGNQQPDNKEIPSEHGGEVGSQDIVNDMLHDMKQRNTRMIEHNKHMRPFR